MSENLEWAIAVVEQDAEPDRIGIAAKILLAHLRDHPSGTVRMPVEPTHDLITAYMKDMRLTNRVNAICHYRAMLRAAKSP